MMYTDPEALARDKTEAMAELRAEAARRGYKYDHEAFADLLREDDERLANGEPSQISPLVRDYIEGFRQRRTPEERERARMADQDRYFAREQAATRWKKFIAEPANVDALIALVGQSPTPTPTEAPWLRKP